RGLEVGRGRSRSALWLRLRPARRHRHAGRPFGQGTSRARKAALLLLAQLFAPAPCAAFRREREKLRKEQERLEAKYADYDELPDEADKRLGEIETLLEAFERRPTIYDPADIAIAGAFVTVDEDGELVIDRGWVRPEDEPVETVE